MIEEKNELKLRCFNFLDKFGDNIKEKFKNICGKTAPYNVPKVLFQDRTSRKNRCLISWKSVKKNNLTMDMLNSFENGIVVEFINEDYFSNDKDPLFIELKKKIGSDDNVSSIISFRSVDGDSSSQESRKYFSDFLNNTEVLFKGKKVIVNNSNYQDFYLSKLSDGQGSGCGNDKWDGFLFVSIKGGQQDKIESHTGDGITLFNPACEYASKEVSLDIDLTMSYFALRCIDINSLTIDDQNKYKELIDDLEKILKTITYDLNGKKISLYNYCNIHPSMAIDESKLFDPIQIIDIPISKFDIKNSSDPESIDLTHNEAVQKEKYYWDPDRKCILSPARPTNLFWSYHQSNMMQQDFNLREYIIYEEEIYTRRQEFKKIFDENNEIG